MREIFTFELRFRLRQVSTYLFFAVLFLLGVLFMSTDVVQLGGGDGRVKGNAPFVIATAGNILVLLGSIIVSALMGTTIYRDFEANAHELFFTTRLTKRNYILGRFLGAYVVTVLVFLGIPLGFLAGTVAPWATEGSFGAFRADSYLSFIGLFLMPNLFLIGVLFFVLGSLTRSLLAIYVQGVLLLVGYLLAQTLLRSLENRSIAAFVDPLGIGAASLVTRYWTQAERSTSLLPLAGPLLYNRLLWTGVGVVIFALGYHLFTFSKSPIALRRRKADPVENPSAIPVPPFAAPERRSAVRNLTPGSLTAYRRLTLFYFREIVRGVPFLVITLTGIGLLLVSATQADKVFDTPVYPVTRIIMEMVSGSFGLFSLILITFYAGELTWRERVLRLDQVSDALPIPTASTLLAKVSAVVLMLLVLNVVLIACGMLIQITKGYFTLELGLYATYFFAYVLPGMVTLTFLAFFVHSLVNQKFLGHLTVVLVFLSAQVLPTLNLARHLYLFGSTPSLVYSDMNGFGPYAAPVFWFSLYWFAVSVVLLLLGLRLWVRGKEDRLAARWKTGRLGMAGTGVAIAAGLTALGTGAFTLYNTDVLNHYKAPKEGPKERAGYERTYKAAWEKKPMPRITGVSLDVDLHPETQTYRVTGKYRLKNKTTRPLTEVALQTDPDITISSLVFSVPVTPGITDKRMGFRTFRFATPLPPGDEIALDFTVAYDKRGFPNDEMQTAIAQNGTFITMPAPTVGYQTDAEVADESERKRQKLPPRPRMAPLTDVAARQNSYIGNDADWIDFEATVRTSPDQTAIAPGYLQREWTENGRHCFHYKMDAPIRNFYSFLSARYAVKKDVWVGKDGKKVALEVYYHPTHAYNLDRMISGMKAALTYCSENYTPYQFRQLRILEFPAYAQFAQSFPNTIPYSEAIGFIARVQNTSEDIDYPFYVTAHETAHQWWAHQVLGADVEGSTMLSESLAEYTALKIMEKRYGPEQIRRFLKYDLDRYLQGRGTEREVENPLVRVQNQQYIHYPKGALVFYALADRIGEERLNAILAQFARNKRFQEPPYTTSMELLAYLRAGTLPEDQGFLTDLFEKITLYDCRATEATTQKLANGKWRVTLTVTVAKKQSDGAGKETDAPLKDTFDIGVFAKPDKPGRDRDALGKPLLLRRERFTQEKRTFHFEVDQEPEKAGIDPYNKMIDRIPGDNTLRVTEAAGTP